VLAQPLEHARHVVRADAETMDAAGTDVPRWLVVQVQTPVSDADEDIARPGQHLVQHHLCAEHLRVEPQAGLDVRGERVEMVKTVAHGILRVWGPA
jgi:hypothetical protein